MNGREKLRSVSRWLVALPEGVRVSLLKYEAKSGDVPPPKHGGAEGFLFPVRVAA